PTDEDDTLGDRPRVGAFPLLDRVGGLTGRRPGPPTPRRRWPARTIRRRHGPRRLRRPNEQDNAAQVRTSPKRTRAVRRTKAKGSGTARSRANAGPRAIRRPTRPL